MGQQAQHVITQQLQFTVSATVSFHDGKESVDNSVYAYSFSWLSPCSEPVWLTRHQNLITYQLHWLCLNMVLGNTFDLCLDSPTLGIAKKIRSPRVHAGKLSIPVLITNGHDSLHACTHTNSWPQPTQRTDVHLPQKLLKIRFPRMHAGKLIIPVLITNGQDGLPACTHTNSWAPLTQRVDVYLP